MFLATDPRGVLYATESAKSAGFVWSPRKWEAYKFPSIHAAIIALSRDGYAPEDYEIKGA